jgi:hypothetical protein
MASVSYQVQYTPAVVPFNWMNLGAPITATNGVVSVQDVIDPNNPSRFYRVEIILQ